MGIKMHPDNTCCPLPIIMAAPAGGEAYFERIDAFLRGTLGEEVAEHYEILCGDAESVARRMKKAIRQLRAYRVEQRESFSFNWGLTITDDLQQPFTPTHENMAALQLHREQPVHHLIAELRRAFSGIVAGNVKDFGVQLVEKHGPYRLSGDPQVIGMLGGLLQDFVDQGRMKLDAASYVPCFELAD